MYGGQRLVAASDEERLVSFRDSALGAPIVSRSTASGGAKIRMALPCEFQEAWTYSIVSAVLVDYN